MKQIEPWKVKFLKQFCVLLFLFLAFSVGAAALFKGSGYVTKVEHHIRQDVPFSHQQHVNRLGLDCQFCHTKVQDSPSAGMPSVEVCFGCHQDILNESKTLGPVREAYHQEDDPLVWKKVTNVPDHVYFDHSAHISANVSCKHCHGDVEQMPLTKMGKRFTMQWCLSCHEEAMRSGQTELQNLKDCYTCHR